MREASLCFSTPPHYPAGRRQTCRTRLSVDEKEKSIDSQLRHTEVTEPASGHIGLHVHVASCILGVGVWQGGLSARRSRRQPTAACASDGRSVGAWTERALNIRGREGVKAVQRSASLTVKYSPLRLTLVFTVYLLFTYCLLTL